MDLDQVQPQVYRMPSLVAKRLNINDFGAFPGADPGSAISLAKTDDAGRRTEAKARDFEDTGRQWRPSRKVAGGPLSLPSTAAGSRGHPGGSS